MRKRQSALLIATVGLLLAIAAPAVASETDTVASDTDPGEIARSIVDDGSYQNEWPEPRAIEPPPGAWLANLGLTGILFWVFVAGVAAIALLILLFIVREILERRYRGRRKSAREEEVGAIPPWLAGELDDPERLADAGDFAGAIHALLLQALRQLILRSRQPLGDSLTSREVARRLEIGEEARGTLWELLRIAERVVFGDEPSDRDEYQRCRACYERLREVGS